MLAIYRNQLGTQKMTYECANFEVIQKRLSYEPKGKMSLYNGEVKEAPLHQAAQLGIVNGELVSTSAMQHRYLVIPS